MCNSTAVTLRWHKGNTRTPPILAGELRSVPSLSGHAVILAFQPAPIKNLCRVAGYTHRTTGSRRPEVNPVAATPAAAGLSMRS